MTTELRHKWAMLIVLIAAIMFGPAIADAVTGKANQIEKLERIVNDLQWMKSWIQSGSAPKDDAKLQMLNIPKGE